MSRTFARLTGDAAGGDILLGQAINHSTYLKPAKHAVDMLALGTLQRNIFAGGSANLGIAVSADGDVDLPDAAPLIIDNTGNQFSGFSDANGAVLVAQFRFLVRVSDAAISVTPKLRYGSTFGTITTVATISGEAACSAIAEDYSDTDQYQTIAVTLPSGSKLWKPQLTVASTGGNPYTVWGRAWLDLFIQSS